MPHGHHNSIYLPILLVPLLTILVAVSSTNGIVLSQLEDQIVKTYQDENNIIITVDKTGISERPIIVRNQSGVVDVVVVNFPPSAPDEVTVIDSDGNTTQLSDVNMTNFGHSIIIAPRNQSITETPGGAIVVDAPPCNCATQVGKVDTALQTNTNESSNGVGANNTALLTGFLEPLPARTQ